MRVDNIKIGIVGLGYVGLPLAVEFSKKYQVKGFDTSKTRVNQLNNSIDETCEIDSKILDRTLDNGNILFSENLDDLKDANFYIITVPTPIDRNNNPDLKPLKNASLIVGQVLKDGDIVVYESTVFPGATEEICVPILEKESGLVFNENFFCGYSPERINPGDKKHTLTDIVKITSGSTQFSATLINKVYSSIINAGTYQASSIKIAEAAKVIENTQRDLNIALVNELAIIFNKMNISTHEVLDAASTKWNFQDYRPGLVGGHCIGVDPYYLTYKSESIGYTPKVILAGRKINDGMSDYLVQRLVQSISKSNLDLSRINILILGLTFKENSTDTRNSKAFNVIEQLLSMNLNLTIFDPNVEIPNNTFSSNLNQPKEINEINLEKFDVILITVSHNEFRKLNLNNDKTKVIFDISGHHPDLTESL